MRGYVRTRPRGYGSHHRSEITVRGQIRGIVVVVGAVLALAAIADSMRPVRAMPPFAQAYAMNCDVCHTIVPALNAYGRYVQRTGYASLNPETIHKVNPLWPSEALTYDTQDSNNPHKIVAGNLSIHGAGFLGNNVTFHLHEWVVQGNRSGSTDTLWLTYNNLFHRDGHLYVGKIEPPGPSPFSQWFDFSGFATPAITVGEHAYGLAGNRWGTKFEYVRNGLVFESAYLFNSGDLNTATNFSSDTDKTWQWRLAYASPDKPIEVGVYGAAGSFPISDGTFDHYNATAAYLQIDPQHGLPGLLTLYQRAYDPNPAPSTGPANSKSFSVELYEPLFNNRALVAARNEVTDDGMGTVTHGGNVDLEVQLMRRVTSSRASGLFYTTEVGMTNGSPPAWRAQLLYATTVGR